MRIWPLQRLEIVPRSPWKHQIKSHLQMLKRSCRNTCTSTNLNISVVCWNTSCCGNSRRLNCHFTVTFIAVKQHKERVRALWQRTTAHWNQERVKRKFPTISERDCLSADGRCWWVVLVSAGWWMNTWVNPCGWWIWPEPLVVPTSPSLPPSLPRFCLQPTPSHKSSSKPCVVRGNMFSFLLSPFYERPQRISPVLSLPSLPVSSLCLPFPVSPPSSIHPPPSPRDGTTLQVSVFKCSVKHPYSG